jgi:hypothetical protein
MSAWSKAELLQIADTDEMHVSPLRGDWGSYATPTLIWSVVVEDGVYVRAYNGRRSRWYQAAKRRKVGRVAVGGLTKEVSFEPVDGPLNDRIDDAYRTKYRNNPYLAPMLSTRARSATVRIAPSQSQNRMTPDRREKRDEQRQTR